MIPNADVLYKRIADAVIASVPANWSAAKVSATFYPDVIKWRLEYRLASGVNGEFDISRDLRRSFQELRQTVRAANQPVWCDAVFEISSSGKFSLNFGYDDSDENGDKIHNE